MNTLLDPDEILELVDSHYRLSMPRACSLIRRGFNDHYLVTAGEVQYVFRVYLNGKYYIASPDAFRFELDLLHFLHTRGIDVAPPIRRADGKLLGWTSTPRGQRATALFAYASGRQIPGNCQTIEQCLRLGRTTAAFHRAANDFDSDHARYHLDLRYLVDEPLRLIEQDAGELWREHVAASPPITDWTEAVRALDVGNDEYGIIHGDLHERNMHFQSDKVTLFDFDHCAYGWRAYDLACSFYLPEPQQAAFMQGYEQVRPLSPGERECLPVFARLRKLWDVGDWLATSALRDDPPG